MPFKKFLYRLRNWETWHFHAKYIPIAPVWLWYCLRARSWWFFTPSNPTIAFGGFEGESKKEIYNQLPPFSYPASIYIEPAQDFAEVIKQLAHHRFTYPFVVKPDVGMMGYMFRKIENEIQLQQYHTTIPFNYLIQELINYPIEVSVFYYRFPGSPKGVISGFLQKDAPYVTGNGKSTLTELIDGHPVVRHVSEKVKTRHKEKLNNIIPQDEMYYLSNASNRSEGGKIMVINHEIDDKLLKLFDHISHYTGQFYYGRYDIKCASIEDLKQGKNYSILEYNGSGSGTQHVYGNGNTLWQACKIILHHWKVLYTVSKLNHKKGVPYWSFKRGWQFLKEAKKNIRILKKLHAEFPGA